MALFYRFAADAIVMLHMAYASFILLGMALILTGVARRWSWIRNLWFRLLHLGCIVVVAVESWLGIPCPLTVWEQDLRRLAGQATYQGAFLANWVHDVLFVDLPPVAFTLLYTAFAVCVLLTFVLAPLRLKAGPLSPS